MKLITHVKRRIKKELGLDVDLSKAEQISLYLAKEKLVNVAVDDKKLLPIVSYDEAWHYWPKTGQQAALAIRD